MVVLLAALVAVRAPEARGTVAKDRVRVTVAVMPAGTTVTELAGVPGMGVGLLSAGIGNVSAAQTYLDIGQGARVPDALYDDPLPNLELDPGAGGTPPHVAPLTWREIRDRAAAVPADVVPGLLGGAFRRAGVSARVSHRAGLAGVIVAGEQGAVLRGRGCGRASCSEVDVTSVDLAGLEGLASRLREGDLLIAIERPPPATNHELAVGIAGGGFDGTLTSDSTRMRGFVLSTDIAPTILSRLGIAVPSEMSGEPIHTEGGVDAAYVQRLEDRLAVIGPWRAPVIGLNVLIWFVLAALAGIAFRGRGLRVALPAVAVTLAYVPAVLLLCAALEPTELGERLIVGVGSPALALLTLRLVPGMGALAIAAAVSVTGYAVDVIAGSHLVTLSLIGPNPAAGVRFYGIGNELEATVSALVPIATGAALATWAPRASTRAAVAAFALTGLAAAAAFAPGRFGADVGAAIAIPIGTGVAIAASLQRRGLGLLWVVAAPLAVLGALVGVDLALGGDAHLTRSILRAGGLDQVAQVAQRRLVLSADSFERYVRTAYLWIAVALIVVGFIQRRRIRTWFGSREVAWAGLLGALAATLAGTLANDSGALLLMIGTALCAATVGVAWATQGGPEGAVAQPQSRPAGPVT